MCLVEMETPRGRALITACTNPVADGMVVDTKSEVVKKAQEGCPRVSADQPSPRLPGVRPGRRVPSAGSHHRLRTRGVAVCRGETALREADPGLGPGLPRPGALHPLRPLHPVLRRGLRRSVDRVHRPGQLHPDQHLSRPAVLVLLLGQHGPDLPGRRPHRQALPIPGPALGPGGGRVDLSALHIRASGSRSRPARTRCFGSWGSMPRRPTGVGCPTSAVSGSTTSHRRID